MNKKSINGVFWNDCANIFDLMPFKLMSYILGLVMT